MNSRSITSNSTKIRLRHVALFIILHFFFIKVLVFCSFDCEFSNHLDWVNIFWIVYCVSPSVSASTHSNVWQITICLISSVRFEFAWWKDETLQWFCEKKKSNFSRFVAFAVWVKYNSFSLCLLKNFGVEFMWCWFQRQLIIKMTLLKFCDQTISSYVASNATICLFSLIFLSNIYSFEFDSVFWFAVSKMIEIAGNWWVKLNCEKKNTQKSFIYWRLTNFLVHYFHIGLIKSNLTLHPMTSSLFTQFDRKYLAQGSDWKWTWNKYVK